MSESFFQFRSRIKGSKESVQPVGTPAAVISVAQLTANIDSALRSGLPAYVLVKGEISNLNIHRASGHIYFTLKDDKSCIDCVMFRGDAEKLAVVPRDGDESLAGGAVRVYAQRGRYQLYVTTLTPVGRGALEVKFQQLRAKLEAEGLFDADRKRPLPKYPQTLAIVTSRQAAALQDILKVFARYPWLKIRICHVPVQGDGSAEQIAAMLAQLNRATNKSDLILLGRGGGSLEDLWEFNEEIVARAIVTSQIPIITGIGHEVDVAIADLVADYHAHTPTEAAQVAVANWKLAEAVIDSATARLSRSLRQLITHAKQRLTSIERHELFRRPTDHINRSRQLLDDRDRQLRNSLGTLIDRARSRTLRAESRLAQRHPRAIIAIAAQRLHTLQILIGQKQGTLYQRQAQRLDSMEKQLAAFNPHGVLSRGYSITTLKSTGQILHTAQDIHAGETLVTQFHDGTVESVAKDGKQGELF